MHLVEREPLIEALDDHLAAVTAGSGRMALIAGEAGVGKTALIDHWAVGAVKTATLLHGACDGSATPRPLGPFIDAFPQLADAADTPDRVRLLATVSEALRPVDGRPTVLIIEDAQWADEASLDLLRSLAVRIADVQALIVATYRSDEVGPAHPLAVLIGDLAGRATLHTDDVPPLSLNAVRALARNYVVDADELHRRTGGNAFHVSEVLLSGGQDLPATVRDAVRARVARLSPESRAALDVVALIGQHAELEVIEDVLGAEAAAADEAVRRGVLLAIPEGLTFRHDLARSTIAADVPPMRRIALHRAILHSLLDRPALADPARIAHHAEAARDFAKALPAAVEAAERSAALGAHREAVLQYERALRVAPDDDAQRVALNEGLSYELYLTGRMDEAITARATALRIHQAAHDHVGIAISHRWLSRLHWYDGHGAAAEAHGLRAVELTAGETSAEAAMALSNLAQLRILAGDIDGARHWGHQAISMARFVGADDVMVHALNNVGAADCAAGLFETGVALLTESLDRALAGGMHDHAARAYGNLVGIAISERRLDLAEHWLPQGIDFCQEHDIHSCGVFLQGQLALLHLDQGRIDEARRVAERVLQGSVPASNRLGPLLVRALTQIRSGDNGARATLLECQGIAEGAEELQRLGPTACAQAELAWVRNEPAPESLRRAYALTIDHGSAWDRGELASWMAKAGWLDEVPLDVAEPYALQLASRWEEAAQVWAALGCPYDEALALAESPDIARVEEAVRLLNDIGASAAAARVSLRLSAMGGKVPRQRRTTTLAHPAGLTVREAEVLDLLVGGVSNSDIGAALGISARTAEHHVSAVLAKLGANTRLDAVDVATNRGLVGIGSDARQDR